MRPMPHPFRFGVQASAAANRSAWVELARRVEDQGYSTLTMPDHLGEQLAPVPALMAAADATTTLRVGGLVLDNDFKHPVVLAKELATLDVLSDGRLEIGIGAGWMRADYDGTGIPYDPPAVRIDRMVEAIRIIKALLASGPAELEGDHYQVTGVEGFPKPVQQPHPPILIGGQGDRMLRVVAEHADIWNYPGPPSAEFRQRDQVLNEHCAALGRDSSEITRSMQTIVRCDDPAAPAATRALLLEMIEAGVTHIVLAAILGGRPVRWLADEIIEPVLAQARHR